MWPEVRFPVSASYVGWVCLLSFSPGTPVFPSPHKPTLPNSNWIRNARTHVERAPERSQGVPWVNIFHFHFHTKL